jgi:crossover junction endodeoxyribonuclease RuvC
MFEKIVLGVDPGTSVMGFGLIKIKGTEVSLLQYGVLHLSKYATHELKLKKIFDKLTQIISEYLPDEMAIEAPFFHQNVQSMLKLGRAQGVAMAAALAKEIPTTEYLPKQVKQSITGNGNASKEQVAYMLEVLLKTKLDAPLLDATDALAAAMCHYFAMKSPIPKGGKSKGWSAFVTENPKRLK